MWPTKLSKGQTADQAATEEMKILSVPLEKGKKITNRLIDTIESQNCFGWKQPLRSSSPTVYLTLPSPSNPCLQEPHPHIF